MINVGKTKHMDISISSYFYEVWSPKTTNERFYYLSYLEDAKIYSLLLYLGLISGPDTFLISSERSYVYNARLSYLRNRSKIDQKQKFIKY